MSGPSVTSVPSPGTTAAVWPGDKTKRRGTSESGTVGSSTTGKNVPSSAESVTAQTGEVTAGWPAANLSESGALWDRVTRPPITEVSPKTTEDGAQVIDDENTEEIMAQLETMDPDDRKSIPLLRKLITHAKRSAEEQGDELAANKDAVDTDNKQAGKAFVKNTLKLRDNGRVLLYAKFLLDQQLAGVANSAEEDGSDSTAEELAAAQAELDSAKASHQENLMLVSDTLSEHPELYDNEVIDEAWEQIRMDCAILYGAAFLALLYAGPTEEKAGGTIVISDTDQLSQTSSSASLSNPTLMAFIRKVEAAIAEVKKTVEDELAKTNQEIKEMQKTADKKYLQKIQADLRVQKQKLQGELLQLIGYKNILRVNAGSLSPEEFKSDMQGIEDLEKKLTDAIEKIDKALENIENQIQAIDQP
ncbi:MAG: hypothetical protein WC636_05000 [Candidatus Margulisiibacteriota bacterium]